MDIGFYGDGSPVSVCMPSLQKENEEAVQIQNMEAIKVISSLLQVKIPSHYEIED